MSEEPHNATGDKTEPPPKRVWNSLEIIKLLGELALILIGLRALWIYNGQLTQMKQSVEQAAKAIGAANRSADAADLANTQARDQFREDQRPYVWQTPGLGQSMGQSGNTKVTFPWQDPEHVLKCGLAYENYGRSPAIVTRITGSVQVGVEPFRRFKKRAWEPDESVLPPGKSDMATVVADFIPPENLKGQFACYFRIQYQDTTSHPYEMDMCFYGIPGQDILSYCPTSLHLNRMIDCEVDKCEN